MKQGEHVVTITTMEYTSKRSGRRCLGQVIQLGVLRENVDDSDLSSCARLPTGLQATYRDEGMAIEHGDLALEVRREDLPLVIPHFGPDPLKGFGESLELSDLSLHPWPRDFPLFFRELVYGIEAVKQWFHDRGGIYPRVYHQLTDALFARVG
jgi:hypothetical protein